jgi:hypothetical protein
VRATDTHEGRAGGETDSQRGEERGRGRGRDLSSIDIPASIVARGATIKLDPHIIV